jgi:hypothetical protein
MESSFGSTVFVLNLMQGVPPDASTVSILRRRTQVCVVASDLRDLEVLGRVSHHSRLCALRVGAQEVSGVAGMWAPSHGLGECSGLYA